MVGLQERNHHTWIRIQYWYFEFQVEFWITVEPPATYKANCIAPYLFIYGSHFTSAKLVPSLFCTYFYHKTFHPLSVLTWNFMWGTSFVCLCLVTLFLLLLLACWKHVSIFIALMLLAFLSCSKQLFLKRRTSHCSLCVTNNHERQTNVDPSCFWSTSWKASELEITLNMFSSVVDKKLATWLDQCVKRESGGIYRLILHTQSLLNHGWETSYVLSAQAPCVSSGI